MKMNNVQLPKIDDDVRRKEAISILLKNELPYALFVINENDNMDIYANEAEMIEEVEDYFLEPYEED